MAPPFTAYGPLNYTSKIFQLYVVILQKKNLRPFFSLHHQLLNIECKFQIMALFLLCPLAAYGSQGGCMVHNGKPLTKNKWIWKEFE